MIRFAKANIGVSCGIESPHEAKDLNYHL